MCEWLRQHIAIWGDDRANNIRSDLYYRLNVFPVDLPPLRERRQDIPELISHFARDFAGRMGKPLLHIRQETMTAFISYSWPGNVRELQNLIERAVIRSNDDVLPNPLPLLDPTPPLNTKPALINCRSSTFNDCTRSLILRALEDAAWMIGDRKVPRRDWDCPEPR
jgi:transcriptional regulator with GAF, ATPase, and Fis domain